MNITKIIILVKNYFSLNSQIFCELDCEDDNMMASPHKLELIKLVVIMYLKIRFHAFIKNHSLAINCTSKINKFNKLVLFFKPIIYNMKVKKFIICYVLYDILYELYFYT